ncbi:MAG: hypothetical protein ACRDZN_13880, partial [Acidimicrobiales bacterium]
MRRPARQRATYNRRHGVGKLMGAYHVGATRWGRLEKRRVTTQVVLEFFKDIRRRNRDRHGPRIIELENRRKV